MELGIYTFVEATKNPTTGIKYGDAQRIKNLLEEIIYEYELFGNTRFLAQMSVGTIPHEKMLRSIELFGKVVAPKVREYVKKKR